MLFCCAVLPETWMAGVWCLSLWVLRAERNWKLRARRRRRCRSPLRNCGTVLCSLMLGAGVRGMVQTFILLPSAVLRYHQHSLPAGSLVTSRIACCGRASYADGWSLPRAFCGGICCLDMFPPSALLVVLDALDLPGWNVRLSPAAGRALLAAGVPARLGWRTLLLTCDAFAQTPLGRSRHRYAIAGNMLHACIYAFFCLAFTG